MMLADISIRGFAFRSVRTRSLIHWRSRCCQFMRLAKAESASPASQSSRSDSTVCVLGGPIMPLDIGDLQTEAPEFLQQMRNILSGRYGNSFVPTQWAKELDLRETRAQRTARSMRAFLTGFPGHHSPASQV